MRGKQVPTGKGIKGATMYNARTLSLHALMNDDTPDDSKRRTKKQELAYEFKVLLMTCAMRWYDLLHEDKNDFNELVIDILTNPKAYIDKRKDYDLLREYCEPLYEEYEARVEDSEAENAIEIESRPLSYMYECVRLHLFSKVAPQMFADTHKKSAETNFFIMALNRCPLFATENDAETKVLRSDVSRLVMKFYDELDETKQLEELQEEYYKIAREGVEYPFSAERKNKELESLRDAESTFRKRRRNMVVKQISETILSYGKKRERVASDNASVADDAPEENGLDIEVRDDQ